MRLRPDSRATILGRTGSGKSRFALWLLSHADLAARPWVIVDIKRDRVFDRLVRSRAATLRRMGSYPGKSERGIQLYRPEMGDNAGIEDLLSALYRRGRCGIWLDEIHNLPQTTPLNALFSQGRSKSIQMITCTQRPRQITRSAFTEADYYSVFHFNDRQDINRASEFIPLPRGIELPRDHSSIWYDVRKNTLSRVLPVGTELSILDRIDDRSPGPYFW